MSALPALLLIFSAIMKLMKPQPVLETLQRLTAERDDIVWTTGVGQHQMWAMQYLLCDRPRTFITSGGLGTMGYGIPAAIGAKAARPEATVICVDGDGCFQMTQQELATSVLEKLPIVVVLINNGHLGMVRQWQDMFFEERFSQIELTHHLPDYAALAEAYQGCDEIRVVAPAANGKLEPEALNDSNKLELSVYVNEAHRQAVLVARLDNLGKGASGAAVQNLKLMLGLG